MNIVLRDPILWECSLDRSKNIQHNDFKRMESRLPVGADTSALSSTLEKKLLGKWKVIADTAGQGLKGELHIQKDGTFTGNIASSKSRDNAKGTYTIEERDVKGVKEVFVCLLIRKLNAKPIKPPQSIRLKYNKVDDTLSDGITITYARVVVSDNRQGDESIRWDIRFVPGENTFRVTIENLGNRRIAFSKWSPGIDIIVRDKAGGMLTDRRAYMANFSLMGEIDADWVVLRPKEFVGFLITPYGKTGALKRDASWFSVQCVIGGAMKQRVKLPGFVVDSGIDVLSELTSPIVKMAE